MVEEHNSVKLQAADRHNLVAGTGDYRWSQVHTPFKDTKAAITYLNHTPEQLVGSRLFRIIDLQGTVLMEDSAILAQVRKR